MTTPFSPCSWKDLALLREAGIRVAIAPSAKERIDEVLGTYKVPFRLIKGVRVTSGRGHSVHQRWQPFDVSNRVMTMLSANGIAAVIGGGRNG